MDEATATEVVERLRARRVFAGVNRRAGVYNVGVRVVIPDGREAIWDNDGAAGLEAVVLRDGVLVGFVPQVPDSEELDAAAIADIIAATDYDAPPPRPAAAPVSASAPAPAHAPVAPATPAADPPRPPGVTVAAVRPSDGRRGWRDRWRRRG
jgi:hypothetical protein